MRCYLLVGASAAAVASAVRLAADANPLDSIPAATGRSEEEVLKLMPKDLQGAIERLSKNPGKKGDCVSGDVLKASFLEGDDFPECKCPKASGGGTSSEEVKKYTERADDGKCNEPKGMWNSESAAAVLRYKYEVISKMFGLKKGYRVMDWGAGCGHQLALVAKAYDFKGVGIDLVEQNEKWAKEHMPGDLEQFCTVDGSGVLPFAKESFDLVMSNAALYHLKGFEAQCDVLKRQVPHVLVPGGCAWFGWLGSSDSSSSGTISPEEMMGCFSETDLIAAAFNEQDVFGTAEYDDKNSYSVILCKPGASGEGKTDGDATKAEEPPADGKEVVEEVVEDVSTPAAAPGHSESAWEVDAHDEKAGDHKKDPYH
eukprot:TRINITY_DN94605_c0_g1_i1.p1 TRINITY_DN94605_c0_g1~~TRINITY_DN94605_c0_g1_i1.p1  ORF type:complete len:370 (-),score=112.36 TRINITY_DN94605_c0_g1_i1:78-1187(-)